MFAFGVNAKMELFHHFNVNTKYKSKFVVVPVDNWRNWSSKIRGPAVELNITLFVEVLVTAIPNGYCVQLTV